MGTTRCQICGEKILQRDSVVRVVAEIVIKKKGDPSDPLRWTDVRDWTDCFISHRDCAAAEIQFREEQMQISIPCESDISFLFQEDDEPEPSRDHLRAVE